MSRSRSCAAAVLAATFSCHVAAQTFQNGRAPLIDGEVQNIRREISSLDGPSKTKVAVVSGLSTARTIMLRLEYASGPNVPPGAVLVRDAANDEVAQYSAEKLAEEHSVWTPLIRGSTAQVEVMGPEAAGNEFRVLITAIASHVPPAKPTLNIVRDFDLEDIEYIRLNQPEIFDASRSVAKISFVSSKGPAVCTGFMVSGNRMLTNHHCINSDETCKSASIIFGFDKSKDMLGEEMQRCSRLVDKEEKLDAALIEVSGSPGIRWGHLAFSDGDPTVPEPMVIVQHPAGFHKMVSRKDCVVATMPADGVTAGSDFGHSCDTMDGSSGSPVLRRADLKVVGLHHWGFVDNHKKWSAENRAVQIRLIRKRFEL